MKRLRRFKYALSVGVLLSACAQPQLQTTAESDGQQALSSIPAPSSPPPPLVPQPEGTPLPPRDPRIAERWPPEIKQLVDNMLSLFPKGQRPPSTAEVARRMGITLTEKPLKEEGGYLSKWYAVSGTRYIDLKSTLADLSDLKERYYIDIGRNRQGDRRQILTLVASPPQSGYCLDPYELAIYTGGTFLNGDTTVHSDVRIWAPAYVWGMFDWSRTGRYLSPQGFSIVVGVDLSDRKRKTGQMNCVHTITVGGPYPSEE